MYFKTNVPFAILLCSKRSVPGEEPVQAEKPPAWSRQFLGSDCGGPVTVSRDVPVAIAGEQQLSCLDTVMLFMSTLLSIGFVIKFCKEKYLMVLLKTCF